MMAAQENGLLLSADTGVHSFNFQLRNSFLQLQLRPLSKIVVSFDE